MFLFLSRIDYIFARYLYVSFSFFLLVQVYGGEEFDDENFPENLHETKKERKERLSKEKKEKDIADKKEKERETKEKKDKEINEKKEKMRLLKEKKDKEREEKLKQGMPSKFVFIYFLFSHQLL